MAKLELTEHKNCQPNDCEVANHLASSAIAELDAMDKYERKRLEQRVIDGLKQGFDNILGGNWNIILGKEVQITVGLAQYQRLLRFKHGDYRLFCFETYTSVKHLIEPPQEPIAAESSPKNGANSKKQSAEASPKSGVPKAGGKDSILPAAEPVAAAIQLGKEPTLQPNPTPKSGTGAPAKPQAGTAGSKQATK